MRIQAKIGTTAVAVLAAIASAPLAGGCASVPREAGFNDVSAMVANRTGKRVAWNQGTAADAAVTAQVQSLLEEQLTVEEAVQVALLNNRELQAVYEDLMVAQADLVQAGLLSNPVFDTEIRFFDEGVSSESSIVMNFLDIFYIPLRQRIAGAQFEATKRRVAGAVLDLAGEVYFAFYELQGSQQSVEMRRQVVLATEASAEVAQRMHEAGNITDLDLANERVLYEQSKVNLSAAEEQVVQVRERLNELMGLWGAQTQWQVATRLPDPSPEELDGEGLEARAIAQSLELGALRRDIEAQANVLGIVRPGGLLPNADLGLSAEGEAEGEWGLGPALAFPIPLFSQGQPAIARAQAELRRARQHYYATAVMVRSRVRAAHSAMLQARDRARYYRAVILPLRQEVVDQTQLQYNAMQVGPFQLLLAKQQQIDAASEYIDSLERYWLAKSELDQILNGRLPRRERLEPANAMPAVRVPGAPEPVLHRD